MKSSKILTGGVVACASLAIVGSLFLSQRRGPTLEPNGEPTSTTRPAARAEAMDVVFVLDTTASMSKLIEGAKRKIWAIASQLSASNSELNLRIGLVAYRDFGDQYVTRVVPLSGDMDAVYAQLSKLEAHGGGDGPEHVNKGLYDAINAMQWRSKGAARHIFLVGDAPPHDDYNDVPKSHELAQQARDYGITLHAIRCGTDMTTETAWARIANLGGGTYASIAQNGGMQQVATRYDRELKKLNDKLTDSVVGYGKDAAKVDLYRTTRKAMSPSASAENAFYAANAKKVMKGDLVDDAATGSVDIGAVPESALPGVLRGKSVEERRNWVKEQRVKRAKLKAKIRRLSAARRKELAEGRKGSGARSFDETVIEATKGKH